MQTKNIGHGTDNIGFYLTIRPEKDSVNSAKAFIDKQKPDKLYDVEIKEYRKPRSLTANGYYHALKSKLAGVQRTSVDEIHEIMLSRYGQLLTDDNEMVIVFTSASDLLKLPRYKKIGEGVTNGKTFGHYTLTRGSSTYDSREFSILLDGLISECREVGIDTLTDAQRALLKYEELGK